MNTWEIRAAARDTRLSLCSMEDKYPVDSKEHALYNLAWWAANCADEDECFDNDTIVGHLKFALENVIKVLGRSFTEIEKEEEKAQVFTVSTTGTGELQGETSL